MTSASSRSGSRRFVLPGAVSLLVVGAAPFMGQVRDTLKEAFPDQFVLVLAALVVGGALLSLGAAVARIREDRVRRYALLGLATVLFGACALATTSGFADVDAVERFHFLEYGLVALLFFRAERRRGGVMAVAFTLLWGTLVGIVDEWAQWLVPVRSGDVRDVGLNAVAVACGILFALALMPPRGWTRATDAMSGHPLRALAATTLVAFGLFFHAAHLGYEIDDGEGMRFRSTFTREALLDARRTREAFWRENPPRELRALAIEDFYMTEGGWRVQQRNAAYARGDLVAAWMENRVLEKYYDPFLDLRSFIGKGTIHRWTAGQRAEVEAGSLGGRGRPYLSPAGLDRIYTSPSKPVFWTIVVVGSAGLLWWPFRRGRHRQR